MGDAEIVQRFKTELKQLLNKYNLELSIDFDRLGGCGPSEALIALEEKGDNINFPISFNLDDIAPRKECPW